MDQGWRRFHLLLVFLTLWRHALGYPSWNSQVNPRSLRYHKAFSPRGSKSLSDASVTGNIPVDVNSNMHAVKGSSRSQFSSAPGNYESVSQTQSSASGLVSVSLALPQNLSSGVSTPLQLQGSSGSNVQGMASQSAGGPGSYSQYDITYKDRTGLQAGGSGQLVPAQGGSGHFAAFDIIGQSSNESLSSGSSDLQLGGISSQLPSQGSGASQFLGASSQNAPESPAHAQPLSPSGRFTSQVTSRQGSQSHFTSTSQDPSSQFVPAQGGSASLSGLSSQSLSTSSQYSPVSSAYPSLGSLSMPVSGPSSVKTSPFSFSSGSRGGSSQLATSRLSGLPQGVSSHPVGSYVQSQGSPSQLAFGSPQYASASSAAAHTTSNRYNQAGAQSLSQSQIPLRWQPSASSFSQGSQTSAAISQSAFTAASVPAPSKLLSVGRRSQSVAASLYSSASMASPQAVSWQYSKITDGALYPFSQTSQRLQPSVPSSSQSSQSSGAALSQSRFSVPSASDPRKSLASGRRLTQSAPASLYSMPSPQSGSSLHGQAAGSVLSFSQSPAPQRWQPFAPLSSQGFQSSSTAVSQSSSASQGAKFPRRFSLASVSSPSQLVSTEGASSYSGLVQSPSSSAPYPLAYSKPASSPLGLPSQLTSSQGLFASSSQSMAGGTLGASSRYASAQREVGSNIASLQPQVAAGQYAPAPSLDVKVPVYSHATSSGSTMSSRLQSQTWQPTISRRVFNRFPTSGAALAQTSFSPQSVQSSSRFSSVAGGTSRLFTQSGGSYTGSSQLLGSVGQSTPGSPAYNKFTASSLGVSTQSASGPSSSSQYSPLSTTGATEQLASSSGHLSAQGESGSSVGSSLLSQDALANVALAPVDTSMSVASQASSGIQTSGAAAFQSGSSQASSSLSSLQALSSPVDSVTQSASANSQVSPLGHLNGPMTQSSGLSVQAASEGVSSVSPQAQTLSESAGSGARVESQGMFAGSTSVLPGSYDSSFGQSAPVSNPSQGSVSGYYGVKG